MAKMRLGIVAALVSVLAVSAAPGHADHQWKNYHWPHTSTPFSLQVLDSMTSEWNDSLVPATYDWSLSSVLELNLTPANDDLVTRSLCEAVAGKIRACNAPHPDVTWAGLATVWADDKGHIQKATVQMNDFWFSTPLQDSTTVKRHVLCQQMGRTLGLDYQYTQPSCMDNENGQSSWDYARPGSHDYAQLEAIYAHSDGGSTVKPPDPPPPPKNCKHRKHDKKKKCNNGNGRGDDLYTTARTWEENGLTVTQYALRVQ
jgi:hypothetical protein